MHLIAVASLAVPMNTMNTMDMGVRKAMNMMAMLRLGSRGMEKAAKAREPQLQKGLPSTLSCDARMTGPQDWSTVTVSVHLTVFASMLLTYPGVKTWAGFSSWGGFRSAPAGNAWQPAGVLVTRPCCR